MQQWFKEWFNSPYYSGLYAHRDHKEAAAFIDRLVGHLNPAPGSRMIDVGCGKGRHALQLASKGFDVTGIDLSEESISEAKRHETDNLHFYVHDMRRPCWINYFDYAFNFFTSFGYFETNREHDDAMRNMAFSLRRGGIIVIDYLNVSFAEAHLKPNSELEKDECHYVIRRYSDEKHFIKEIIVTDKKAGRSFTFFEKVAKFRRDDFANMMAKGGLKIVETFGDYSLEPFDEINSGRLILIAKRSS